jgi:hypothetical protein
MSAGGAKRECITLIATGCPSAIDGACSMGTLRCQSAIRGSLSAKLPNCSRKGNRE